MYLAGMGVFGLATVGVCLSHSMGMLLVFRLVQGVGAGLLVPAALAVVGLLSFINTFNEFAIASVVVGMDPNQQTLALGLYQFISEETNSNWPLFAAGTVLACLPVLVVFFWLQRFLTAGLTSGAVK